jgi:RHS repeat-associated protein
MAKVNPIRFSTKYQDDENDLLYYGYRYYKASTGTWVSRDPLDEPGLDPVAFNNKNIRAIMTEQVLRQISGKRLFLRDGDDVLLSKFLDAGRKDRLSRNVVLNPFDFVNNDAVNNLDSDGRILYAAAICTIEDRKTVKGVAYCKYVCNCPSGYIMSGVRSVIWNPCDSPAPYITCFRYTCGDYVKGACVAVIVVGVIVLSDGTAVPILACAGAL